MTMELEQTLQKRFDEANAKKEAQLAQIHELNTLLQNELKALPRRPRDTLKELDDKAEKLERKRTVTSISLAEERQILKEINVVKKTKTKVEEYNKMEDEIQSIKKQLSDLRDGMSEIFAASDEIYAALEKVKMANNLECGLDELSEKKMTCPKSKLGMVIGKNGSKIKQIQTTCKVSITVAELEIIIIGSEASIERATKEIVGIIRSEEEAIELEKSLLHYLTSKYVHVLRELQKEYTNSFVDVSRSDGKLVIQGSPEDVADIKAKVFDIQIVTKKRLLAGRDINIIIGKKGTTIDRLCTEHMIPIDISNDVDAESSAIFIGPPEMVDAAFSDVEKLINDNKEVETVISISRLKKSILLAEGGIHIKDIQAKLIKSIPDGQCFASVNSDYSTKDHPEVVVKAKQLCVSDAHQFVTDALKALDKLIVKCRVDPYVAPRIIGRGGETIKKIIGGKPFFVEVDRLSGELSYGATTTEGLEELRKQINETIDNNCVLRINADSVVLKRQYRELRRSPTGNDLNEICSFDLDEDNSCYIVRGKKQNLAKAKILLDQFILENQFAEVPITNEDRDILLTGGKKSKIAQFSKEMGVKLHIDKEKFSVVVRGSREQVGESAKKLSQYLNGGDGFNVTRFTLNEQVIGIVIGKGGKTRQQLEQNHKGVTINISRANVVTIRGPSQVAADCQVEIAKLVASARVSQSISVTNEQKESLEQKEYTKKIFLQMPVNVSATNGKIVVRGTFHDVRDAVSLLNEMLTGEYKTFIELDAPQFSKLRNTVRDPSHFDRIESACGAKLELDLTTGSISISGKRSHVKRAKDQLYSFLDFLFPNQLIRLKIAKPLFFSVGRASALAELSAEAGGVAIYLDRDLSFVVVRSIDEEKVRKATVLVREKIKEAERLAFVFELSASDSWIIPIIIGKKGGNVSLLRKKYAGCKIDISKEYRTITIVGESEDIVGEVREAFVAAIEKARCENVFVTIQSNDIPSFVGKGGSHVKELSAKYGVDIQNVKKGNGTGTYKISGETLRVKTAKEAIDTWLDMREKAKATLEMTLEREQDIAAIIGHKGVVARSIEDDYKCRIDVDKKSLVVTIRGPSEGQREAALSKMKYLLETYRTERITRELAAKEESDNVDVTNTANGVNHIGPVETEPPIVSNDENGHADRNSIEVVGERSQFPSKPVGVTSKPPKTAQGNKKKVDASISEGTEAGKSLFALLTSQD